MINDILKTKRLGLLETLFFVCDSETINKLARYGNMGNACPTS